MTPDQRYLFDASGFLHLPGILQGGELQKARAAVQRYVDCPPDDLPPGFNPQNDGKLVRITVPQLSTEVRRKLVIRIKELAEETRVSIRNVRRDGNKAAEQAEKDKTLTEDLRDDCKDEIQNLTKKFEEQVNEAAKLRESEVMQD